MKEYLESLKLVEKESFIKEKVRVVKTLQIWSDNNLSEAYVDDTIGIGVEDEILLPSGETEEYDGKLHAVWLTKYQAILLRSYLDNFIQLAETEAQLDRKRKI